MSATTSSGASLGAFSSSATTASFDLTSGARVFSAAAISVEALASSTAVSVAVASAIVLSVVFVASASVEMASAGVISIDSS
jgi:hypothetical protein